MLFFVKRGLIFHHKDVNIKRKEQILSKKQTKRSQQTEPIYIALDTDALSMVVNFERYLISLENGEEVDADKKISRGVKTLHELIKSGILKPVVTRTPLQECPKSQNYIRFLCEYCFTPDLSKEDREGYRNRVFKLAQQYCQKDSGGLAPMKSHFSHAQKTIVPDKDALVMAEASLLGVNLITNNAKHFVYYEDQLIKVSQKSKQGLCKQELAEMPNFWRRAKKVSSINALSGHIYRNAYQVAIPQAIALPRLEKFEDEKEILFLQVNVHPKVKKCSEIKELSDITQQYCATNNSNLDR